MTPEALKTILAAHADWLADRPGGKRADLRGANLIGADLRGADLCEADLRRADLHGADLREANLCGANLCRADLLKANLYGADLREANLYVADLRDANLYGANLCRANLRQAKLSGALVHGVLIDLSDVPVIPDIHKTIYAAASQPDALSMARWHRCETTHCRVGWVITLAGEAGAALEDRLGTNAAAALIYVASDHTLERVPDLFATKADALADMRRLAEASA